MDWKHAQDRAGTLVNTIINECRQRPQRAAAVAFAAAILALGIWSCQTAPKPGRGTLVKLPDEPDVRIRIKGAVQSTKLSGPAEFVIQPDAGKPAMLTGPLTVNATIDGVRIIDGKGKATEFPGRVPLDVVPVGEGSAEGSQRVKVDGVTYPGNLRIAPRGAQAKTATTVGPAVLDLIETVPMETYLIGVVGAELYKDWPQTAFEVQAVCARTYALHERERSMNQGRDYDLESTTYDQAYNGGVQLPVAVRAMESTRGVVLTWQGRLLRAYYSSTCGGRNASAADIWPTGPGYEFNLDPPIQAHHRESACESSPRYRWEAVRDRAELSRRIKEWGKANGHEIAAVGQVNLISVAATNVDQRPTKYTIADDKRKIYTIECEQLRQACNQTVAGLPELTKETRVWASDMEIEIRGSKVTIKGRGFGHGVGMCQFCTKGMADQGKAWRDIVVLFYPGVKLERAY